LSGFLRAIVHSLLLRGTWPPYFIRVARRSSEVLALIYSASQDEDAWTDEFLDRASDLLFEGDSVVSVYAAATQDRFDVGHALAVVAATIASTEFGEKAHAKYRESIVAKAPDPKEPSRKLATISIPRKLAMRFCRARFTPLENQNFSPADDRHYDLSLINPRQFSRALLEGLRTNSVQHSSVRRPSDYRVQAGIASTECVRRFGSFSEPMPPLSRWRNGATISATDQRSRLLLAAGDAAMS
jgi:hypothetical protein